MYLVPILLEQGFTAGFAAAATGLIGVGQVLGRIAFTVLRTRTSLAAWSVDDVWAYVAHHQVPVNALYARGYASIGCEPCTRPIRSHEDARAGRWWWEDSAAKECGLHVAEAASAADFVEA